MRVRLKVEQQKKKKEYCSLKAFLVEEFYHEKVKFGQDYPVQMSNRNSEKWINELTRTDSDSVILVQLLQATVNSATVDCVTSVSVTWSLLIDGENWVLDLTHSPLPTFRCPVISE